MAATSPEYPQEYAVIAERSGVINAMSDRGLAATMETAMAKVAKLKTQTVLLRFHSCEKSFQIRTGERGSMFSWEKKYFRALYRRLKKTLANFTFAPGVFPVMGFQKFAIPEGGSIVS